MPNAIARTLVAIALSAAFALSPAVAQELPDYRVSSYPGAGNYAGTRYGDTTYTTYAGDVVTEQTRCQLEMEFLANGQMRYNAGEYFYRKIYRKKTIEGFLVTTTEIRSVGGRGIMDSRLTLWVAENAKIRDAKWRPGVEIPGMVTTQVTWTDAHGQVRRRDPVIEQRRVVYCDVYVLWRGSRNTGPGLDLTGAVNAQPDSSAKSPWIKVNAKWRLQPVQR